MSSSTNNANNENILILGKGPVQRLVERSLSTEKMYSINFAETNEKFCLSLHYNGSNSYLFVNGIEIIKFKAKDTEINPYILFLGNISKDFPENDIKKQDLMAIFMILVLIMIQLRSQIYKIFTNI